MESDTPTGHNYGIDLLRILSMYMVVMLHVLGNGGILEGAEKFSLNYYTAWFLETAAYCAVNVFAMITGYVMAGRKFSPFKIIPLWLQVWFYSAGITLLFIFVPQLRDLHVPTAKEMLKGIFLPVISSQYWYFTAYFGMYFFIPFFNKLIQSMDKRDYHRLFLTMAALFSFMTLIADAFTLRGGYTTLWLGCLYFVGAYFKLYPVQISKRKAFCLYVCAVSFAWLSKLVSGILIRSIFHKNLDIDRFVNYTSPLIVLSGISLLLLFSNLRIANRAAQKAIAFVGSLSFSVYLIHVQPLVWVYIFKGKFAFLAEKSAPALAASVLLCAVGVFALCIAIDLLRHALFKILHIAHIPTALERKICKGKECTTL